MIRFVQAEKGLCVCVVQINQLRKPDYKRLALGACA